MDKNLVAASSALALILSISTAAFAEETFVVVSLTGGDTYINLGQSDGVGNQILWDSGIQDDTGASIGEGAGTCSKISKDNKYMCHFVWIIEQRGQLIVSGIGLPDKVPQLSYWAAQRISRAPRDMRPRPC